MGLPYFFHFLGGGKHKNYNGQTFRSQIWALFSAIDFLLRLKYQEYLENNN